jgi:hypothetical protein
LNGEQEESVERRSSVRRRARKGVLGLAEFERADKHQLLCCSVAVRHFAFRVNTSKRIKKKEEKYNQ